MKKIVFILFFATLAWIMLGAVLHAANNKETTPTADAVKGDSDAETALATEKTNIAMFRLKKMLHAEKPIFLDNKTAIENFKKTNPKATEEQLNKFKSALPMSFIDVWEGLKAEINAFGSTFAIR